jgi:HEAT repeat protein
MIADIGEKAKDAIPNLISLISKDSSGDQVSEAAAYALGEIGTVAKAAVPSLRAALINGMPVLATHW